MRRFLAGLVSVSLVLATIPAGAVERSVPVIGRIAPVVGVSIPSLSVPALPGAPAIPGLLSASLPQVSAIPQAQIQAQAAGPTAQSAAPSAVEQLQAAEPTEQRSAEAAGAQAFDGAAAKRKAELAAAAAASVALPLAAGAHLGLGSTSYEAANVFSVALPFPQIYRTYAQGHARGFPAARAALGTLGALGLGLINATLLDKPMWGVMQIFVGLGMVAPYFIGRALEKTNAGERLWKPKSGISLTSKLVQRLRKDGAAQRSLAAGALIAALSVGLYAAAAAVVPGALTAALTPKAIDGLLLGLQLFKMALFVAVFAPDVLALIKGRQPRSFALGFNLIYLGSVVSFAVWGFSAAASSGPGPIRDQYLVLAARNVAEALASGLSLAAILRARKK